MAEHPPIVEIAGPFYIGILLNWFLYGILIVQVYIYWSAFKEDQLLSKVLVYFLFIADSFQSILLANDGFLIFARGFTDVEALNNVHLVWLSVPFTTAVVSCTVQIFFAYRIYLLSGRSVWIPIAITLSSLTQGVAAILAGVKNLELHLYSLLQSRAVVEITTWHIATVVSDVLIAVSMSYYLYKADTGLKRTHAIIINLIQLTIETGTATAAVAIIDLVLFLAIPGKVYFVTPSFVAAKLYANTVVVIFNNRAHIVTPQNQATHSTSVSVSEHAQRPTPSRTANQIHFVKTRMRDTQDYSSGIEIQKSVVVWDDSHSQTNEMELARIPR